MTTTAPRVYLDSNVFIAAFEHVGAHSDHAWWILHAIEKGEMIGATSEMTLAEILVKPIEARSDDLAASYDRMIVSAQNFEVLPVKRKVLISAAGIRARRSAVKLPDAIHLASAMALGCTAIVTDDRRFNAPEGIKLFEVNPFTVDDIMAMPS
jgi:predicted nucleic acid-binding protein